MTIVDKQNLLAKKNEQRHEIRVDKENPDLMHRLEGFSGICSSGIDVEPFSVGGFEQLLVVPTVW